MLNPSDLIMEKAKGYIIGIIYLSCLLFQQWIRCRERYCVFAFTRVCIKALQDTVKTNSYVNSWDIQLGYNQGQNLLDCLSSFSSIHPFTALKWDSLPLWDWIVIPNSLSQNRISNSYPHFNLALNSCVHARIVWINIENGEGRNSLINIRKWSNNFVPDCRLFF